VGPRGRLAGGAVAPYPHANKGGPRDTLGPFGCEPHRYIVSVASGEQLLMGSCLIQHGMQEVNPLIGIRLRHAKELSLHCLDRILFHIRQNEELFVGYCG
jgi:hypothetical protein